MPSILFHCPISGQKIQGFIAEGAIDPDTICVPLDCPMCKRPHLIDPKTGKVPDTEAER